MRVFSINGGATSKGTAKGAEPVFPPIGEKQLNNFGVEISLISFTHWTGWVSPLQFTPNTHSIVFRIGLSFICLSGIIAQVLDNGRCWWFDVDKCFDPWTGLGLLHRNRLIGGRGSQPAATFPRWCVEIMISFRLPPCGLLSATPNLGAPKSN